MNCAIIGYTGFVGGNLINQNKFDFLFNTSNISDLKGGEFDLLVCAAPAAVKWKAISEPETDLRMVRSLMDALSSVTVKNFIQISTIDVYPSIDGVDEDAPIDPEKNHAYGKHRFYLEQFIGEKFKSHLVVRLPGLFGPGLKKNFIFDIMNSNCLHLTHRDSMFQFYDLNNLWRDIQKAMAAGLSLVNFSCEPTSAAEVARECFNVEFANVTEKPPASYNMKSKHAGLFGGKGGYMYGREKILEQIRAYASEARKGDVK